MKTLTSKAKPMSILFGILALIAVVTITPHAFAITYTTANDPHGPMATMGLAAGMGVAGVMSGFGIWMAIKRSRLH